MGDESTSNEKEARFWDLYRTYYAFARTFGRLGRWRAFLSAIQRAWRAGRPSPEHRACGRRGSSQPAAGR